jgi:glycosyltransferase involved in cell wall biosynthesis
MYNKKVYFVGGAYMGCYYVRCFLPMLANGWTGNYIGLKRELKEVSLVQAEMQRADIIVFHRADTAEHHKLAIMMKALGKKIVFDNDDTFKIDKNHAFYGINDRGFKENIRQKNNVINNFIRNADLVTCSTEYLADEYRKLNKNVVVLPNCVDASDWDEPLRNNTPIIRIGVVGSAAYYHDFDIIKPVLEFLNKDKRVQLVLFGLHSKRQREIHKLTDDVHKREYNFWDTLTNIEHVPWVEMIDYFTTLNELRLDIMLIPRRDDDFNRAKSNIKFLESGMCEIPVIASSFKDGPYEEIESGVNGILIKNNEGWLEAIESLINSKDRRREMGKLAHSYALNNYNINDKGYLWNDAYNKYL